MSHAVNTSRRLHSLQRVTRFAPLVVAAAADWHGGRGLIALAHQQV